MQPTLPDRIRNDFGYHPATEVTGPRHDELRRLFADLALTLIELTPVSREQSLALTNLQQALMWANAAVACNLAPLEPRA